MEDAESVRAVCSATPTALDCTGDLVAGDNFSCGRTTIPLALETSGMEMRWQLSVIQ